MKKIIISIILSVGIVLSFAACNNTDTNNSTDSSNSSEKSEVSNVESEDSQSSDVSKDEDPDPEESKDESEPEDSAGETQIKIHGEDGIIIPAIEGTEEFVKIYKENLVDTQYIQDLDNAVSSHDLIATAESSKESWIVAIEYILIRLEENMDEVESSELNSSQTAWQNDLPIMVDEFNEAASGKGSIGEYEVAYKTMLVYRERAIKLAYMYYEETGVVELPPDKNVAMG